MSKFKNVESKLSQARPSTAGSRRPASASLQQPDPMQAEEEKKPVVKDSNHVAFGRNTASQKTHGGIPKVPRVPQKQLTTSNLQAL